MSAAHRFRTSIIFGTASVLAATSYAAGVRPPTHAHKRHETVLLALRGGREGATPGTLVMMPNGTIIVSAQSGGVPCPHNAGGCGVIFKLTPANGYKETVLYAFQGGTDGATPRNVVADGAGDLYGTTDSGGEVGTACPNGCGTVYKLARTGNHYAESVIYRFQGGVDGYLPQAGGVVVDPAGSVYGQTVLGGASSCACGTVYRLVPTRNGYRKTTVHSFEGPPADGALPQSAPFEDGHGVLYGTTSSGGDCPGQGCGVLFVIAPNADGTYRYEILHSFEGPPSDGSGPAFGVTAEPDGTLVGTTNAGGTNHLGIAYRLRPTGASYTVLTNFNGINGANPRFLSSGGGRRIYGAAFSGGSVNEGLVYALERGDETVLYTFGGAADGANPTAVVAGPDGTVYGVTAAGGDPSCGCGVVFKITP